MRDIIPTEKKYSDEEIEYLKAKREDRIRMVKKFIENMGVQN